MIFIVAPGDLKSNIALLFPASPTSSLSYSVIMRTLVSWLRESPVHDSSRAWRREEDAKNVKWGGCKLTPKKKKTSLQECYLKPDLQGAVAAVEVVQTGWENELLICASQSLTRKNKKIQEAQAFSLTK